MRPLFHWKGAFLSKYHYVNEKCKLREGDVPCLLIYIQRTNDSINLGISRSEVRTKQPEYWGLPPVKGLAMWLTSHGYGPHLWWLGYRRLHSMHEDELYLALAGNKDKFVTETVETTWNLFCETREMLEEANQALVKHVPLKVE